MKQFEVSGFTRRGDNLFKDNVVISMMEDVFSCAMLHLKINGIRDLSGDEVETLLKCIKDEGYKVVVVSIKSKSHDVGLNGFKQMCVFKSKYWNMCKKKRMYVHFLYAFLGD